MKIVRNNQAKPYIIYLQDEQITENYLEVRWEDGQACALLPVYEITEEQANAIRSGNCD